MSLGQCSLSMVSSMDGDACGVLPSLVCSGKDGFFSSDLTGLDLIKILLIWVSSSLYPRLFSWPEKSSDSEVSIHLAVVQAINFTVSSPHCMLDLPGVSFDAVGMFYGGILFHPTMLHVPVRRPALDLRGTHGTPGRGWLQGCSETIGSCSRILQARISGSV